MGKNKGFMKRRGEKRRKNSSGGDDKFKKKRNFCRFKGKDETNYSNKSKHESNIFIPKKSVESEGGSREESEDENVFNQLISSLNVPESSKYISSSDSDDDDDDSVKDLKTIGKDEEEFDDNDSFNDDDNDTSLVEDLGDEDLSKDPFEIHFQRELGSSFYKVLSSENSNVNMCEHIGGDFPILGKYLFTRSKLESTDSDELKSKRCIDLSGEKEKPYAIPGSVPVLIKNVNWNNLNVKTQIQDNICKANIEHANPSVDPDKLLSPFQKELFSIVNNYQDLYYPNRTLENEEDIRFIYSLHAINHALKTRLKVIHHNARLPDKNDVPDEFRDQGLVRPKVLIIVPFRDSALRIIKIIMSILLPDEKANIVNKKRFFDEFTGGEIAMPHKNPKPVDYERTFKGNCDDNFRIGISVTKKSLKLYADFYSSDIIVASPLGLRLIIGAEGEAERDYDFLASIEVLVLDQAEIFLMQNWDHLLHVMDHLHLQPQKGHGTDFSRVRNWALNGWTQYYRQTLLFSSQPLPLITSLFVKKCKNYAGKIAITNPVMFGTICQVAVKVPQVFCRIECSSSVESVDRRFDYFIKEVLPQMRDPFMKHTIIFVPSYLDYVMIRNYFKKETISFVQICEYSKDGKIARARDKFFHGESHFLLYSERFHFFRRIRVKGIHHIVFYQPPTLPHFYSELCNLISDDRNTVGSVTTLYTKYDIPQLAAIVGTERANRLLKSNNNIHRIISK